MKIGIKTNEPKLGLPAIKYLEKLLTNSEESSLRLPVMVGNVYEAADKNNIYYVYGEDISLAFRSALDFEIKVFGSMHEGIIYAIVIRNKWGHTGHHFICAVKDDVVVQAYSLKVDNEQLKKVTEKLIKLL